MSIEPDDDDEADAEFREAIGKLLSERAEVAEAYRRLWKFITTNCDGPPLHVAHFCEAMAMIMGEVAADNVARAEWSAAFDYWLTFMRHAAERHRAH